MAGSKSHWRSIRSAAILSLCLNVWPWLAHAQTEGSGSTAEQDPLSESMARLLSDDPEEHDRALNALVNLGEAIVPELESIARDSRAHPRYRAGSVYVLGHIGARSSMVLLQGLWDTGIEQLGGSLAIQVAMALSGYGQMEPLRAMMAVGDEILGAKAAIQLGLLGDQGALPDLIEAFESPGYARMRPFFAIALGLLGDASGESLVRSGLGDLDLRNHCAVALSRLGHANDVVFELEFAMGDSDPLVRRIALDALLELDPSNLDEILERAAADADPQVKSEAEAAIEQRSQHPRRRR